MGVILKFLGLLRASFKKTLTGAWGSAPNTSVFKPDADGFGVGGEAFAGGEVYDARLHV